MLTIAGAIVLAFIALCVIGFFVELFFRLISREF